MWKLLVVVLLVTGACTLQSASLPTASPEVLPTPEPPLPTLSVTQLLIPNQTSVPTRLPGSGATNAPVGNGQVLGQTCAVYVVYSGTNSANVISLRARPTSTANQLVLIPNNARVYLVPGAQEVAAENYHWLNIIYMNAAQSRYQGWAARDSFMQGGIRDASIATLRPTGEQAPC